MSSIFLDTIYNVKTHKKEKPLAFHVKKLDTKYKKMMGSYEIVLLLPDMGGQR